MVDKETPEQYYSRWIEHWDGRNRKEIFLWPDRGLQFKAFKDLTSGIDFKGKSVLDWGCGNGDFWLATIYMGATSYCGYDPSESLIKVAKETVMEHIRESYFNDYKNVPAVFSSTPPKDKQYNISISCSVASYGCINTRQKEGETSEERNLRFLEQLVTELYSRTKSGGWILFNYESQFALEVAFHDTEFYKEDYCSRWSVYNDARVMELIQRFKPAYLNMSLSPRLGYLWTNIQMRKR